MMIRSLYLSAARIVFGGAQACGRVSRRLRTLFRFKKMVPLSTKYPQYEIGRHSYGKPVIIDFGEKNSGLKIGAYCSIARGTTLILGGEHRMDWVSTYPFNIQFEENGLHEYVTSKGIIDIGNDVWIGANVTILSGVTVGDGAVLGAGSVVVHSVPPYAVACGNPARVLRNRFDDDTIRRLLEIQWWNWPDPIVREMIPYLSSDNMTLFFEKASEMKKTARFE